MAMNKVVELHRAEALRARFYRSVAETLTQLRPSPGRDRKAAMLEIAATLMRVMDLPLVWVGLLPAGGSEIQILGAAGPAKSYAQNLLLNIDPAMPSAHGPVGRALRDGRPRLTRTDAPEFAPWREAATRHGLGASLVAVAPVADGAKLALCVYGDSRTLLGDDLLDWAQRLIEEIARFWDHQALLDREQRLRRYRTAQRTIQQALLAQPDPAAIYRTLAAVLVDIAGAQAVDVFADDGGALLRRMALAGPMAEAIRGVPIPPRAPQGVVVPGPTRVFSQGQPFVRVQSAQDASVPESWRQPPLAQMGAVGCWPIFGTSPVIDAAATLVPSGVFAVIAREADTFDAELCSLLDEIADAAGLALRQYAQREALARERERQAHLALHDALTGLPNRRALEHQMEGALARSRRHHLLVAVGMLDLDDFKPVNERMGHAIGDRLLLAVAEQLRGALRDEDYVARLGGDEFVLVFEDLARIEDLEPLLERVRLALERPCQIDDRQIVLHASLGMALFPLHADDTGEQLLRRADQAMYQVKTHKREAHRWWALPPPGADAESTPSEHEVTDLQPYGESAARLLRTLSAAAQDTLESVVEPFYLELEQMPAPARLLQILPAHELAALHDKQREHLRLLLRPDLDASTHRRVAEHAGRAHAGCGIETVWLSDSAERLRETLDAALGRYVHRDRRALLVLHRRLAQDRQWQLEGMRAMQRERDALIARISALAWSSDAYASLMQGVVDTLARHDEIISCSVGRPDANGAFAYEAVGGTVFADYLRALARGEVMAITADADSAMGRGPSGRAWRSGGIERCLHFATDPAMVPWREFALQLGVRSSAALPLGPKPGAPLALLVLYSRYPGGFSSDAQQAFVAQLKTLLDLAMARLAPDRPGTEVLPFTLRERWRERLAGDGVEMHYQPIFALAQGRVVELEALARLRDVDGSLLSPGRFLPALNADDLLRLFREGLRQALAQRAILAATGYTLDITVNLPPAALYDPRYVAATAAALSAGNCPPRALLLEILENASEAEHALSSAVAGVLALKALGVRVAEDDLGAGHSSLARLRQWPFDRVKIDQTLVRDVAADPLRTLRFIRQLTLLGQALGIEVVVEGLETPGLVEAALLMGADFGQGYALARPCAAAALAELLAQFHWSFDAYTPRTALGALAATLLSEERLRGAADDPESWRRLAAAPCRVGAYLAHLAQHGAANITLISAHDAMHGVMRQGPHSADYRASRAHFIEVLIAQVRAEEVARARAT